MWHTFGTNTAHLHTVWGKKSTLKLLIFMASYNKYGECSGIIHSWPGRGRD